MRNNKQAPSLKTPLQHQIEYWTTNGKGYVKIPSVKIFGQKIALKQWLRFSEFRGAYTYDIPSDEISVTEYLNNFTKKEIETILLELVVGPMENRIFSFLSNVDKLGKLEKNSIQS